MDGARLARTWWKEVPEGESGSVGSRCRHAADLCANASGRREKLVLTASRWRRLHGWSMEQDAGGLRLALVVGEDDSVWLCALAGSIAVGWALSKCDVEGIRVHAQKTVRFQALSYPRARCL